MVSVHGLYPFYNYLDIGMISHTINTISSFIRHYILLKFKLIAKLLHLAVIYSTTVLLLFMAKGDHFNILL